MRIPIKRPRQVLHDATVQRLQGRERRPDLHLGATQADIPPQASADAIQTGGNDARVLIVLQPLTAHQGVKDGPSRFRPVVAGGVETRIAIVEKRAKRLPRETIPMTDQQVVKDDVQNDRHRAPPMG